MLNKITVKNVALIDSVEINFTEGLNVLSGETGSGKSVIIESLNFVLGAKADKTMISHGADFCSVVAEFDVSGNEKIKDVYGELEFDYDDLLIVSRKYTIDGKNSIKVNGNTVNVGMLKKFTSALVDVHGQSEHYELLSTTNQLKLLDNYGGKNLFEEKEKVKSLYSEYKQTVAELDKLGGSDESQRLIRLDVINYQINEITECNIKDGEENELLALKEKLINQEKIVNSLNSVKKALSDEGGVCDILGNATRVLSSVSNLGEEYSSLYERLQSVYAEADDIAGCASSMAEDFDYGSLSLDDVLFRLETIKNVKKKYGSTFDEIQSFLSSVKEEKERLENFNETAEKLLNKKTEISKSLYKEYSVLRELREKTAKDFCSKILKELRELGMNKSQFSVEFSQKPEYETCKFNSGNGFDEIEFFFSANLGEPLKPLSNVISGGEMSRFMLAIKAQSAKYNDIETYIFDEIDAGISGVVARVVAEKLVKISRGVQVIAITHLPQISAFGDNNLLISKSENGSKTSTNVKTLSDTEKIEEISRLVGGEKGSETAKALSNDLINSAKEYKKTLSQDCDRRG